MIHRHQALSAIALALFACGLAVGGCGSGDNTVDPDDGGGRPVRRGEFRVETNGLADPRPAHYEAWFVIGGQPKSGGRFRVNASGKVTDLSGAEVAEGVLRAPSGVDPAAASAVFISIEPDDDTNPGPTTSRVLGGALSGGRATLTASHATAFGVVFDGAAGTYFLDTPTTTSSSDFNRGVAFQLAAGLRPAPGARLAALPTLPASGWAYEGWIIRPIEGGEIAYSTGRFAAPDGFDSDRAGATAGPDGTDEDGDGRGDGFPMPAQDFIDSSGAVPPLVLDEGGFVAAVSIEPEPDNSSRPFSLRLLDAQVPAARSTVRFAFLGLGPIGAGHFEAWARANDGSVTSIGKFRADDQGRPIELGTGAVIDSFSVAGDLLLARTIFVTIEQEGDANAIPARSIVVSGLRRDSIATIVPDSVVTVGLFDDPSIRGSYFLNTYTTIDSADFDNGIWFFQAGLLLPDVSSLALPVLGEGWEYEGWVVDLGTGDPYSTGRFLSSSGSDSDFGGLTAGPFGIDLNQDGRGDGAGFPGQEFVTAFGSVPGPLDLDGGGFRTFLSIEPVPDNDPAPFLFQVLVDGAIDSLGAFQTQFFERVPGLQVSATVTISRGPEARPLSNRSDAIPSAVIEVGGSD